MTSSNPLPDEVREAALAALHALGTTNRQPTSYDLVDAVAPILLAYQAKVDAEIADGISASDTIGHYSGDKYDGFKYAQEHIAKEILAQFPASAVPVEREP